VTTLLEANGGGPQKQPKYVPIFMDRAFTGLYTQRSVLHDPSDVYTARFYGGRPDALLGGLNIELTNRLTLQRRPGMVPFANSGNGVAYATAPDRAFSFQLSDGTIRVIVDTSSSGLLAITSVANASAGTTTYTGTFPGGASNGYLGLKFLIAGFVANPGNNGTYTVTASTTTTLTLNNAAGVAETHAATGITSGGVYWDHQDSTATLLFAKSPGAGQMYFLAVAGVLYMGDGIDTLKYTPLNTNGTIWNWGVGSPSKPPFISITSSGAASTVWQASTVFSTMGLTLDTNATPQIWQIIGTNADGTNPSNPQFGTTGTGEPTWPTVEGNTVVDGGVTWTNAGVLNDWAASTFFTDMGHFGLSGTSFADPAAINVASVQTLFGNFKNSGGLGQTGTAGHEPHFTGAYPGPSGGYFDNNTHWFAIGSYATAAGMKAMRWKPSFAYTGWQAGAINATTVSGVPGFVLTGNLPSQSATPVYVMIPTTGGTSGSGYQPFPPSAGIGFTQGDGQVLWLNLGQGAWQANHAYLPWQAQGLTFGVVWDGANFQVCLRITGAGLSGAHQPGTVLHSSTSITTSVSGGNTTYTLGAGTWSFTPSAGDQVAFSGFTNAGNNGTFVVVSATTSAITVINANGVIETHNAVTTFNPWATGYGSTTTDGGIVWTCVGQNVSWAAGQTWNLPTVGFQPPSPSDAFGGSSVDAANGFVQAVIESGTSGATVPAFVTPSTAPPTTTDGTITWQAIGAVSLNSLSWQFGLAYAYSFKSRTLTDFYSPLPLGGGATPPGSVFLGPPFGSETGAISSASPAYQIIGSNPGAVVTVGGRYSPDPAVDTIVIWRSADSASGAANMFELTEIPNVPALANTGVLYDWTFQDFLPSVGNNQYPGLNILLPAPIDGVNDGPPSAFLPMVYNYQRIWGALGENVLFSGGPDTNVGNPNESFNIADSLPFLAPVIKLVKTPQGIVTFLTDSIEMIGGGPATASFFSVTMAPGVGLLSFNACDVFAGEIYFFSSDNMFRVITPSLNLSNFGFPLGDQFANIPAFGTSDATWDPSKVYVAVHQNGIDNCIFVADGSTGWYRLNPHQVPGAAQGPEPIWSPFGAIVDGVKMVQSIETSPGIKQLLGGGVLPGDNILSRSLTTFQDGGVSYDAFFTMGSITLAHPGQIALLKFLEFDFSGVSFQPTISYLLNEISGTFTPFVNGRNGVPQFDPPSLYGTTVTPASYSPNRYYFSSNSSLARCRHMQVKVDFGTNATGSELYNMTIFGRLMIET
jgi:hypothetical protein